MNQEHKSTIQPTPIMQDFVFGGIESDEGRLLATERERWQGIRHFHEILPLDPKPGEAVCLTVTVGPDVQVDQLAAYMTLDGSEPDGAQGVASNGFVVPFKRVDTRWESLIWNYVEVWQGVIPGQVDGTLVSYRIEGWNAQGTLSAWSRESNLDRTVEDSTLYGYHVDQFTPPQWAYEAVIYQIFVDRFAGLDANVENRWLEADEMNDFMGGTLQGVIEKLDYIADLGVTTIWLSPIFLASSYHGYDTIDFYQVDPRFGTNDDLKELIQQAHARDLRVILDFVVNHMGTDFAPFVEAMQNPESPYRHWFNFGEQYRHGYRTFFNVASMPQIDVNHSAARQFIFDAAQFWLREYDVDGYRLDYAAGPSHVFWSDFRAACRAVKADCWLFGEVTRTGDLLRPYTGRLDGCLDFAFLRTVRQLCLGGESAISISELERTLARSRRFFAVEDERSGKLPNFVMPTFIDNHDTNRFLWLAQNDTARLKLAAGLMFAVGGPPILYYGTEVGLSQPRTKASYMEESRHPMLWGEAQDKALLDYFKRLIKARSEHPALCVGSVESVLLDDTRGLWLLSREYGADSVLIAINASSEVQEISLPEGVFTDLSGEQLSGRVTLTACSIEFYFRGRE